MYLPTYLLTIQQQQQHNNNHHKVVCSDNDNEIEKKSSSPAMNLVLFLSHVNFNIEPHSTTMACDGWW